MTRIISPLLSPSCAVIPSWAHRFFFKAIHSSQAAPGYQAQRVENLRFDWLFGWFCPSQDACLWTATDYVEKSLKRKVNWGRKIPIYVLWRRYIYISILDWQHYAVADHMQRICGMMNISSSQERLFKFTSNSYSNLALPISTIRVYEADNNSSVGPWTSPGLESGRITSAFHKRPDHI